MQKLYGSAAEGETVYSFLEGFDPALAKKWKQMYNLGFMGKPQQLIHEFEYRGEPVILELSINPVFEGEEVSSLACFAKDITDITLRDRQVRNAELRFRALIENSHDGIGLVDKNYVIRYVSPSVNRMLGYTPDELYGKNLSSFLNDDDWKILMIVMEELKQEHGGSREFIYRTKHKNGGWRWICSSVTNMLNDPQINAFIFNYKDHTERINAEQAISNSEALYRSLFHNSPMPIWVCDRDTLAYLEVNDTAVKSYGYSREEFLSMTAFDLRAPENRNDLVKVINEGCANYQNKLRRHIKKNGEIAFAEITVHPITFKERPAYFVLSNDISDTLRLQHTLLNERVNKQIEITKATIAAQEKERNEVGKELHDNVNQMLATVKLYVSSYYKGKDRNLDLLKKSLGIVDDSINEIRKICKSLSPPSLGEVTLKDSLEALTLPAKLTEKNIQLYMNDIGEDQLSDGLKISLYRIVQEQLNNIMKHSNASEVSISLKRTKNKLNLTIVDDGVGFDPETKKSGIGLTNILNRSNTYNGKVVIDSSPGKGCKLRISFSL
jgi:PAS domain S-box-containing protein